MDPNFYFLLKTENIQPLVSTLDDLSIQLKANRTLMSELTRSCDHLQYPQKVAREEPGNSTEPETTNDPLRYLLDQKYKLGDLISKDTKIYSHDPRENQLEKEIVALAKIHASAKLRNQLTIKTIQEYEEFIIVTILPALRRDVLMSVTPADSKLIEEKYAMVDTVYQKYLANVVMVSKVIDVLQQLVVVLDTYDTSHYQLLNQFEVLKNLRDNLVEFTND